MSEISPVLGLPYLQPAQAQKHVTHNEALRLLDVIVQLSVFRRDLGGPPPDPVVGDRYIVGPSASGAWAGQEGRIAVLGEADWDFVQPLPGWRAQVLDEDAQVVFDGGQWNGPDATLVRFEGVGIGTDADATNRLAVVGDASLLTHAGSGHQVKVNKAAAGDTASLLFQTGFSGRAEMGTTGSDQFAVKASADGNTWHEGLRVDPGTGRLTAPNGLTVQGPLALPPGSIDLAGGTVAGALAVARGGTGAADAAGARAGLGLGSAATAEVTTSATDTTTGRLLKVGDFGIGSVGSAPVLSDWAATNLASGDYSFNATTANSGSSPTGGAVSGALQVQRVNAAIAFRRATVTGQTDSFVQAMTGGVWGAWRLEYGQSSVLGPVTIAGGVPAGALIERGSGPTGVYTKFADGLLICVHSVTASDTAPVTWTFPAVFAASPRVFVASNGSVARTATVQDTTATTVGINHWQGTTRIGGTVFAQAVGYAF